MRKLLLCICFTPMLCPMEKIIQTLFPVAVGGFMGYSASRQQHASETERHTQAYEKLLAEHQQLKSDLSQSGLLIRGIHQAILCNPLNTLFNLSIEEGDENGINSVLRHRQHAFNINGLDENGATALHIAARKKNEYCMKFLCALGANPNIPDIFGMAPIHYAAQANDVETITKLISIGADCNIKNHTGYTPLMLALLADKKNATQFLLALKHRRAEIDRAPSPDHSTNLLGSLSIAHEIQRTLQDSPQNSHDSFLLIFEEFLKRNPECLICFNIVSDRLHITKCCEKGICQTCADKLNKTDCAFCRHPLPSPEPYMIFTLNSHSSPEVSSSSAASSSSS